jgi:vancomycin permeability regulator SanA
VESLTRGARGVEGRDGEEVQSGERERSWPLASVARGVALFFGLFTLLSVIGTAREAAFDANVWWVSLTHVPRLVSALLLAAAGVALVAYAVAPRMTAWRRWTTLGLFAFFAAVAVHNVVGFYRVWAQGAITPQVPLPLSLIVAALLGFVAWVALRPPAQRRRWWLAPVVLAATAAACVVLFPLAQILFFGTTDYRRETGGMGVVFGAQVHADGAPSTSLRDRMDTAVELYDERLVRFLLVSGGVGESGYNEALVMREMAEDAGVPADRIIIDSDGVNTDTTVRHSLAFFGLAGDSPSDVMAVSQFYHLPRIKLAFQRAGQDVLTVPAASSAPIKETPYLVLREVPAFWLYYLRAVFL